MSDYIYQFNDDEALKRLYEAQEKLSVFIVREEAAIRLAKKELTRRSEALEQAKENLAHQISSGCSDYTKFTKSGLKPSFNAKLSFKRRKEATNEQVIAWFRNNNMSEHISESIHYKVMQSVLGERVENGESIPADLVEFSESPSIRMNGKSAYLAKHPVKVNIQTNVNI